ncbi:hypothetical protein MNBD_PLANCTO03-1436 [hydrothermal vent metagenome]|uniref:Uncharacterized protein n=1 Tax=hydrothermal vent metagenome TaxID=652676 RepID=A0A3B1E040_9ZZZZ
MSSSAALSIFKPILIVGAIAAIGMGGYNLATTGSPLGSCNKANHNTGVLAASDADAPKSSCDMGSYDAKATQAQLADFGTETPKAIDMPKGEGCSEAMKAACETMDDCPEAMMAQCGDAEDCPKGAAKAGLAADHCEDKKATECEKPADPELTADAEQIETETSEG